MIVNYFTILNRFVFEQRLLEWPGGTRFGWEFERVAKRLLRTLKAQTTDLRRLNSEILLN